jgi:sugar phosphate isomerase/epimerase
MMSRQNRSRRSFLGTSVSALAGAGLMAGSMPPVAEADQTPVTAQDRRSRNRVGAVAYSYQYSIGLFSYNDRPNERFDALQFVEATHQAGGEVAQLYHTQIRDLDEDGLKRLRQRAEELDVLLEVHGGGALGKWSKFEDTMQRAAALGSKVIGCSFGFLMRPDRINTLDAWDEHTAQCEARLHELAPLAKSLGITIGVENHLDFSVEELRDLIKRVNSPNVGVIFDVGNIIGTLDDPTEAADVLGPLTVATHYKDFAIEEVARGFRFCMVPLGCGSLRLREVTERLLKHVDPEMGMSIEMINGQHFELNWLEDRFWTAYRNKTARQVAATLRHVRGKAIDIDEYILIEEVDKLPHEEHVQYEQDRMARCITYLKGLLDDVSSQGSA